MQAEMNNAGISHSQCSTSFENHNTVVSKRVSLFFPQCSVPMESKVCKEVG